MNPGWSRGEFTVSSDPSRLDLSTIHDFLSRQSYWARNIPREILERSIRGSIAFGLYEGERQVGFARVVTDRATFAYLADVFVLESHRGRGLAKWLMECVLAHPELQGLRRWLLATKDAHGLYSRLGFELAPPEKYMEINRANIYTNVKM